MQSSSLIEKFSNNRDLEISFAGDIAFGCSDVFIKATDLVINGNYSKLILNLEKVDFIDAFAYRIILSIIKYVKDRDVEVVLVGYKKSNILFEELNNNALSPSKCILGNKLDTSKNPDFGLNFSPATP